MCLPGYDFTENSGNPYRFIQVVWRATTELGIGKEDRAEDGMTCTYTVARYSPAGNREGEYSENALRGSFQTSYCDSI